jgi:membrane protein involved in colicin uptake
MGGIRNYADFRILSCKKGKEDEARRKEQERQMVLKIAEENRTKQEQEQARIAQAERVRRRS